MKSWMVARCDSINRRLQKKSRLVRLAEKPFYDGAVHCRVACAALELLGCGKPLDDAALTRIADAFPMAQGRIEASFLEYERGTSALDICVYRLRQWSSQRRSEAAVTAVRMRMAMRQLAILYDRAPQVPAGVNGEILDICDNL